MALQFGDTASFSVQMEGPFSGGGTSAKVSEILAPVGNWKGAVSPFSQEVAVDGVSRSSKVDISLTQDQLQQLSDRNIVFMTGNDGGIVTLYAIGDKPHIDLTFQATLTEVIA
jgi:hypothetical protein